MYANTSPASRWPAPKVIPKNWKSQSGVSCLQPKKNVEPSSPYISNRPRFSAIPKTRRIMTSKQTDKNDRPVSQATPSEQQELILQMLPLVKNIVGHIAMTLPPHVSQEDLLSAGLIGLMDAVRRYDASKGSSLKSYVTVRVRGAVLDELRNLDWAPRSVHRQARDFRRVQQELEQRLGREATEAELAEEMKISIEDLEKLLETIRPASFISLQDVRSNQPDSDGDLLHEECIRDSKATSPLEASLGNERQELMIEAIQSLNPIEQKVLALYYYEELRLKEIAEVLEVTESRVSQIHTMAIQRLKSRLERGSPH